jgi:hypothetical protein
VEREVFVVPLARNSKEFLKGEHSRLLRFDQGIGDLYEFFRDRWLFPRSKRDQSYRSWDPADWRLWIT